MGNPEGGRSEIPVGMEVDGGETRESLTLELEKAREALKKLGEQENMAMFYMDSSFQPSMASVDEARSLVKGLEEKLTRLPKEE